MILSFTDATGLGLVESSIGLAFLFGSIISLRLSDWLQGNLKVAIYCGLLGGLSLIIGSIRPSIFLSISVWNPFITDITVKITATPKLIPKRLKIEISENIKSFFFDCMNDLMIRDSKC